MRVGVLCSYYYVTKLLDDNVFECNFDMIKRSNDCTPAVTRVYRTTDSNNDMIVIIGHYALWLCLASINCDVDARIANS